MLFLTDRQVFSLTCSLNPGINGKRRSKSLCWGSGFSRTWNLIPPVDPIEPIPCHCQTGRWPPPFVCSAKIVKRRKKNPFSGAALSGTKYKVDIFSGYGRANIATVNTSEYF